MVPGAMAMKRKVILQLFLVPLALQCLHAIQAPTGVTGLAGDQSVVLHWDRVTDATLAGYHVYRSTSSAGGPFSLVNSSPLTGPRYFAHSNHVLNSLTDFS